MYDCRFPLGGVQVIIPAFYRFKKDQLTVFIRVRMKNSKNVSVQYLHRYYSQTHENRLRR